MQFFHRGMTSDKFNFQFSTIKTKILTENGTLNLQFLYEYKICKL